MKRPVLADTGPLYAAVDPDDAYHHRSQHELRRLARQKREVVLAFPTLLEAYTLVLYRLGQGTASTWLNDMRNAALLHPNIEDYRQAMAKNRPPGRPTHYTLRRHRRQPRHPTPPGGLDL